MNIFLFLISKKEHKYLVVYSIAIGYILKAVMSFLHAAFCPSVTINLGLKVIFYILTSVFIAFLTAKVYESKAFNKLLGKLSNKSINDSIWRDLVDFKNTTHMSVMCRNGTVYVGRLEYFEENGMDSWFALSLYAIKDYDKEGIQKAESFDDRLIINIRDVERVELLYSNDKNK